jgi:hypothetical protein
MKPESEPPMKPESVPPVKSADSAAWADSADSDGAA